jgi:hypothetical protein
LRRADNRLCDGPAAIYGSQLGTICGLALREIQARPGQIGELFCAAVQVAENDSLFRRFGKLARILIFFA